MVNFSSGWIRKVLVFLIAGFVLGVLLASFFDFGWSIIGLFAILALFFIFLFFLYQKNQIFGILILIFIGLIFGLFRYSFLNPSVNHRQSPCQPKCSGLIVVDPDRRDKTTRLTINLDQSNQKILVITDNFTDYTYGDLIEIMGKLQKPENFLTDQGKVFDYQNYLLVRGIEAISYYPKIKIIAHGQGSIIKANLFTLKNNFLNNLQQVIPEPAATLAGGLILGDKGGLGQKTEAEFRRAGLSHIIVLSGYNITIVAESVLKFFSWFSPTWSWLLGLGAIFLFVLMTGGEAAAVRAAMMGSIALIARYHGRTYDAGVALIFAGFLMVLWNPRLLVFDLGFQLSFLATLGLIYLSPIVEKIINKVIPTRLAKLALDSPRTVLGSVFRGFQEIVYTTTGAQLAVYPWLLYRASNASLIGFISNLFVLPAVPLAMFFSFATGLAGFLSYYLSLLISYPTYFLLDYILLGAHWFGSLL